MSDVYIYYWSNWSKSNILTLLRWQTFLNSKLVRQWNNFLKKKCLKVDRSCKAAFSLPYNNHHSFLVYLLGITRPTTIGNWERTVCHLLLLCEMIPEPKLSKTPCKLVNIRFLLSKVDNWPKNAFHRIWAKPFSS